MRELFAELMNILPIFLSPGRDGEDGWAGVGGWRVEVAGTKVIWNIRGCLCEQSPREQVIGWEVGGVEWSGA